MCEVNLGIVFFVHFSDHSTAKHEEQGSRIRDGDHAQYLNTQHPMEAAGSSAG